MAKKKTQSRTKPRIRVAVVTGTRAEFGLLETVLRHLNAQPNVDLQLIVTGMHLLKRFGHTIDDIRNAGWHIDAEVRMQTGKDTATESAAAVARGVQGMAKAFDQLKTDRVVVLGDRIEAFAGATAAALSGRILAHIHGGDRAPGDLDESLRQAITRLAHIHLTASEQAANRLKRMGEPVERIHIVGAPGLDDIRTARTDWRKNHAAATARLSELLSDSANQPYVLLVQHPAGRSPQVEAQTMRRLVRCVNKIGMNGVAIYPNSDPGHSGIVDVIKGLKDDPRWQIYRSLPRLDYLLIASHAAALLGNSSSAIIESASLGVCAVDVGDRQTDRLRCGSSVLHTDENEAAIHAVLRKTTQRRRPTSGNSVYGNGKAGQRIAAILSRPISKHLSQAKFLSY